MGASLTGPASPGPRAPEQSLFIPEPSKSGTAAGPNPPPAAPDRGSRPGTALNGPTPMSGDPSAAGGLPRVQGAGFTGTPAGNPLPPDKLPAALLPDRTPAAAAALPPPGSTPAAPLPAGSRLAPLEVSVPNGSAPLTAASGRLSPIPLAVAPAPPVAVSSPPPAVQQASQTRSWEEREYRFQASDTFATLSARSYGSEQYAQALQMYNREHPQTSDRVHAGGLPAPGDKVFLPDLDELKRRYNSFIPQQPGDGPR